MRKQLLFFYFQKTLLHSRNNKTHAGMSAILAYNRQIINRIQKNVSLIIIILDLLDALLFSSFDSLLLD